MSARNTPIDHDTVSKKNRETEFIRRGMILYWKNNWQKEVFFYSVSFMTNPILYSIKKNNKKKPPWFSSFRSIIQKWRHLSNFLPGLRFDQGQRSKVRFIRISTTLFSFWWRRCRSSRLSLPRPCSIGWIKVFLGIFRRPFVSPPAFLLGPIIRGNTFLNPELFNSGDFTWLRFFNER